MPLTYTTVRLTGWVIAASRAEDAIVLMPQGTTPSRSEESTVFAVEPDQARAMAALLLKAANKLETMRRERARADTR